MCSYFQTLLRVKKQGGNTNKTCLFQKLPSVIFWTGSTSRNNKMFKIRHARNCWDAVWEHCCHVHHKTWKSWQKTNLQLLLSLCWSISRLSWLWLLFLSHLPYMHMNDKVLATEGGQQSWTRRKASCWAQHCGGGMLHLPGGNVGFLKESGCHFHI